VLTLHGHEADILSVAFNPDGKRIVSGGYDKTIKVWDAVTGAEVMTLGGHKGIVRCVAFSPDGRRIASGGDGMLKLWDAGTGAELMTLRGHNHDASSIAFSPDGNCIVSGSEDGTINLWESTEPAGGYELRRTGETARKIVDELYEKHGLYQKVIDELKADEMLDEAVRKVALQIANARLWEDAEKLKKESQELTSPEEAEKEEG